MERVAIISVDGHVKASRAGYRDYVEGRFLDDFDSWVRAEEEAGMPDAGNLDPALGVDAQWDSDRRVRDLETQGVVAEVLFPNGMPFGRMRFEDFAKQGDPAIDREARSIYNRWLADFCAATPGRRAGQMVTNFDDVDEAVRDVHWAREHGLGGIMMPPLLPGGRFFFDPALDPVWEACVEVGLPISQHGGSGSPAYQPGGFAAIMTLAIEHSFFSGRSLWQMILGGVFERFPELRMAFVETEVDWIAPVIRKLDGRLKQGDDWLAFSRFMQRDRPFTMIASEYFERNCWVGVSPYTPAQLPMGTLVQHDTAQFQVSGNHAMFGVDYPHFETIFPDTPTQVAGLAASPGITDDELRGILYANAADLYGFDLAALDVDVQRAGFDLTELASAAA
jgi:predicted TIM-barrel fold metal-dependent hydrolase